MSSKNKFECVVFDLDGTLVSSHKTIYEATVGAFDKLGMDVNISKEKFYGMIGLHFEDIFDDFGIIVPDFEDFLKVYKSIYFDYISFSEIYPHVLETLEGLNNNGGKTAMLTTKSQGQAELIADHFKVKSYFDHIMGRRPGLGHKPSPEPLLLICETLGVNPEKTLMIGDTEMDILCGKNAGAFTCGVTFGYRTRDQLKSLNPDYLIDSMEELINIVHE